MANRGNVQLAREGANSLNRAGGPNRCSIPLPRSHVPLPTKMHIHEMGGGGDARSRYMLDTQCRSATTHSLAFSPLGAPIQTEWW